MRPFLKYAGLAVGIQILLFIIAVVIVNFSPGHNSVAGEMLLYLYWPVIMVLGCGAGH
ncbi:MAG: hypothetical protein M3R52_06980 [Acidobacteriota bacterium]|nr:hypothetical protein [Acidobacteriota bacterium]